MQVIDQNHPLHATNGPQLFGHPVGLYFLFLTELWERFSYYGMRALFVLFLTASVTSGNPGYGWDNEAALSLYGWYTMLVYVASIPGGILADKLLGQKKVVMLGGALLCVGHGVLAVDALWAFYTGCLLIILGVGCLKPNISTMVGGLYKPGDERRDKGFYIFYVGINIGAFLAGIVVGSVGENVNWHYGFGLAGIGMFIGQLTFLWGQKYLKGVGDVLKEQPQENATTKGEPSIFSRFFQNPKAMITSVVLIVAVFLVFENIGYWILFSLLSLSVGIGMVIYRELNPIEKDRVMVLLLSFLLVIVFWGAFEQAGGLMNIYASEKTDRLASLLTLDFLFIAGIAGLLGRGVYKLLKKEITAKYWMIGGALLIVVFLCLKFFVFVTDPYLVPATVFQSVNSFFIFTLAMAVAGFWYSWKLKGKESSSLFKMAVGVIIMGLGFLFMSAASKQYDALGESAMYWLILAYLFHTVGELCSSPVSLSFITKLAPARYVAIIMGVYWAATGLGNKLAGTLGELSQSWGEFETFTGIAIFCTIFGLLAIAILKPLKRLTHGAEDLQLETANNES
jgi:POT family proton-dependent oligopeptide transporter